MLRLPYIAAFFFYYCDLRPELSIKVVGVAKIRIIDGNVRVK